MHDSSVRSATIKRSRGDEGDEYEQISYKEIKLPTLDLPIDEGRSSKEHLDWRTAILSASDALDLSEKEKEDKYMLTRIGEWAPISLIADNNTEFNMLAGPKMISRLISAQPVGRFVALTDHPTVPTIQMESNLLLHILKHSSLKNKLINCKYLEIDADIINALNHDWMLVPQMRYVTSQLFAGSILVEKARCLMVLCIEPYGRLKSVEAHHERYYARSPAISSLPSVGGRYENLCVVNSSEDYGSKIKIGTMVSDVLVTASIEIGDSTVVNIGSSSQNFKTTKDTRIYLDTDSLDRSKRLLRDTLCCQLSSFDALAQLKQVRSKFDHISTYTMCRASSSFTNNHLCRPYTIWTLADYDSPQVVESQAKKASKAFQHIGLSVIRSGPQAELDVGQIQQILPECKGVIRQALEHVTSLCDAQGSIKIIGNKQLDEQLQILANSMITSLKSANVAVKYAVEEIFQE